MKKKNKMLLKKLSDKLQKKHRQVLRMSLKKHTELSLKQSTKKKQTLLKKQNSWQTSLTKMQMLTLWQQLFTSTSYNHISKSLLTALRKFVKQIRRKVKSSSRLHKTSWAILLQILINQLVSSARLYYISESTTFVDYSF